MIPLPTIFFEWIIANLYKYKSFPYRDILKATIYGHNQSKTIYGVACPNYSVNIGFASTHTHEHTHTCKRKDQIELTKQHIQKTILIRFFPFWSRWIIFTRIDVWPLNLFMCIFDKIPITFFQDFLVLILFSLCNIHISVKMLFYWMYRKYWNLTIVESYHISVIRDISNF